jgi:hypothetical protein
MDGAWFDYDDPNTPNLNLLEARANPPATVASPAQAVVEAKPQTGSETATSDIAPEVNPARHLKPDPDARALWIQQ